ncbi:sulfite exporter TauE/SafE family protein [Actinomyces vulturis]|uniref:sulfite exporter TauE/SafE family protein n=1 Tax=Actinomyces vulturis TaxID=1857645 RepID=UPI000832B2FC|nr:sulfite exporter TauE/SafE family protein [Actinomyces vulturis]
MTIAIIASIIALGAVIQRVAGTGFGLIAVPVLALFMGPKVAIPFAIIIGTVNVLIVLAQTWRYTSVKRAAIMSIASLIGIIPGVMLVHAVSSAILNIWIGALILLALTITMSTPKAQLPDTPPLWGITGVLMGLTNSTAGMGGPAIIVYSAAARWPHKMFVATSQVIFTVAGLASLAGLGVQGVHSSELIAGFSGLAVGAWLGARLAKKIPDHWGRKATITLAALGAVSTIIRGVISL